MALEQPLISIAELDHTYLVEGAAPIPALHGINLTVDAGEMVAVVGANGSGKTTLARHLNGLLLPSRGRVLVSGLDTRDRAGWPTIRSQVAMVFQRPEDQIVATTVEDDVAFGPQNLGLPSDELAGRVRQALETVGLWDHRRRPPHFLSAGQQQRVAIAGALAMQPRCLVLDEATAMLDPAGRRTVLDLVERLHTQGMAVILITHSMREASRAGRVVALSGGRLAYDGSARSLFADAGRLAELGLDPPPAAALAAELARRLPGFPPGLLTPEEVAQELLARFDGWPAAARVPETDGSPPAGKPLITVAGLSHTYLPGSPFSTPSLHDVNLQVHAGESVALLGPTGSGKSTLLQQMAGLLQPDTGTVAVDRSQPAIGGGRQVAMLFQRPEEQLFETFVGDDVAYGPRQLGLDLMAVRERVQWAMDQVGLPFAAFKDRFTQGLSGGEQRKAALAGVLALRPAALLLDEPTAGLDASARREVLATLRRLNQRDRVALVMTTHTMEDVVTLVSRAWVLDGGRLVAEGSPRQLFSQSELLASHGLELPEIAALSRRLVRAGVDLPADWLTLDDAVADLAWALSGDSVG